MRCQQYQTMYEVPTISNNVYVHTKSYCDKPFMCVNYGGSHNSKDCKRSRETPAKCALRGGNHPANYKGCENCHKLKETTHLEIIHNAHHRQIYVIYIETTYNIAVTHDNQKVTQAPSKVAQIRPKTQPPQ